MRGEGHGVHVDEGHCGEDSEEILRLGHGKLGSEAEVLSHTFHKEWYSSLGHERESLSWMNVGIDASTK